jgi:hypothetical protein
MNNNKSIIAFVLFLCFFGCAEEKKRSETSDVQVVDMLSLEKIESLKFNDTNYFEKTEIIKLELTDESVLVAINQMEVFENHIYILDEQGTSVKKFNMTGKYIQDIGNAGMGAGEYLAANAFYINPKLRTINVLDPLKTSVLQYDFSGKHLNTIKTSLPDFGYINRLSCLSENEIFCCASANYIENCEYFIISEKGYKKRKCIYQYPVKLEKHMSIRLSNHSYSIRNDEVHYVIPFSDTIYSYKNDEVSKFLLLESGKPTLEPHQIKEKGSINDNNILETIDNVAWDGKYTTGCKNIFETDAYIYCMLNDRYIIDDDGRLPVHNAILLNKNNNKGVYISVSDDLLTPCLVDIFYSFNNTFIRIWDANLLTYFKENAKEGGLYNRDDYPAEVWDIVDNYDEEDNPVLIFYTLKQ